MLSLGILFVLFVGILIGFRRGFVLQVAHLSGMFLAVLVAWIFYNPFSQKVELWIPYPSSGSNVTLKMFLDNPLVEQAYYRAIAFLIIFILFKIIFQIVISILDFLASMPIIKPINKLFGALLGCLEVYFITVMLLIVGAMVPVESIQNGISGSFVATAMVKYSLIIGGFLKYLWF